MSRLPASDPKHIREPLRSWYLPNRRELPWRRDASPYRVWISEVMLQQTQVKTVIPYYERFLARFPDEAALAAAGEEEVLEHWAGLGYYSRGRNLRAAARCIVRDHGGTFPDSLVDIRELPGIGEYTSAAIGSIAFGHEAAVIDGNVERVLCRYLGLAGDPKTGDTRKRLKKAAQAALDVRDAGTHNQAMMELGALICTPRKPRCGECPLRRSCRARKLGEPERYPAPRKRRAVEEQHWAAAILSCGETIALRKTPSDSELLPGHWGVPLRRLPESLQHRPRTFHRTLRRTTDAIVHSQLGISVSEDAGEALPLVRHSITHRKLRIHPVRYGVPKPAFRRLARRPDVRECLAGQGGDLTALFRKIIERAEVPPGDR